MMMNVITNLYSVISRKLLLVYQWLVTILKASRLGINVSKAKEVIKLMAQLCAFSQLHQFINSQDTFAPLKYSPPNMIRISLSGCGTNVMLHLT